MTNYNNKKFIPLFNSDNGETSAETIFHYQQEGNILTCRYTGGRIITGHLIGLVDKNGHLDMRYHQVNNLGQIMTGQCHSTPEIGQDGKLILHEEWQWTSGDCSSGKSTLIEI
jgi:hypothetical protein